MTTQEQEWLNSLLAVEDGLTDWELSFICDMERKDPAQLSEPQHNKLEDLCMTKGL